MTRKTFKVGSGFQQIANAKAMNRLPLLMRKRREATEARNCSGLGGQYLGRIRPRFQEHDACRVRLPPDRSSPVPPTILANEQIEVLRDGDSAGKDHTGSR